MSQSRSSRSPNADTEVFGHVQVVATEEQLVLERNVKRGCAGWVVFISLAVMVSIIPLVFFLIGIANNTLFSPLVLTVFLGLGIPAAIVIWYLSADMFNRQIITCDRRTLHHRHEPIWFFNSPVNVLVQDVRMLGIESFESFTTEGARQVHYRIYIRLHSNRCIPFSFSTTDRGEIEFIHQRLKTYLPELGDELLR